MEYYKIDPLKPDRNVLNRTIEVLRSGGIIVYPTNTLYGLGVDAFNLKALERLFIVKQRTMDQPVSLMVASIEQLVQLFARTDERQQKVLRKLLPGKFTVILESKFKQNLAYFASGPSKTKVGFRVAELPFNQKLLIKFGNPISSTSANVAGKPNAKTVQEIIAQFGDRLDLILDAGPTPDLKGSTIIDLAKNPFLMLREGSVNLSQVKKIIAPEKVLKRKEKFVITFVCSGNICRSPMAEGILKKFLSRTKFKNLVVVQSAGTLELTSGPAHPNAISVARLLGVDIAAHQARTITREMVEQSDLIIAMALNHFEFLKSNFPDQAEKVVLLKTWERKTGIGNPSIPDPIGHDINFFEKVAEEIKNEIKRIMPFLFQRIKKFVEYNDLNLEK